MSVTTTTATINSLEPIGTAPITTKPGGLLSNATTVNPSTNPGGLLSILPIQETVAIYSGSSTTVTATKIGTLEAMILGTTLTFRNDAITLADGAVLSVGWDGLIESTATQTWTTVPISATSSPSLLHPPVPTVNGTSVSAATPPAPSRAKPVPRGFPDTSSWQTLIPGGPGPVILSSSVSQPGNVSATATTTSIVSAGSGGTTVSASNSAPSTTTNGVGSIRPERVAGLLGNVAALVVMWT